MNAAASLLSALRSAGGSIRCENGRLLVEAPVGAITDRMREQLVQRKAELIQVLQRKDELNIDQSVFQAQSEIADLLTLAYQRWSAIGTVGDRNPDKEQL